LPKGINTKQSGGLEIGIARLLACMLADESPGVRDSLCPSSLEAKLWDHGRTLRVAFTQRQPKMRAKVEMRDPLRCSLTLGARFSS
jgi:hypothetical protein